MKQLPKVPFESIIKRMEAAHTHWQEIDGDHDSPMRAAYNALYDSLVNFNIGDKVWVDDDKVGNIVHAIFESKKEGVIYIVVESLSNGALCMIHSNRITRYEKAS